MIIRQYCAPAQLFFYLSILSVALSFYNGSRLSTVYVGTIFVLIMSWVLNYICVIGYTSLSWFIALLPFLYCMSNLYLSFLGSLTPVSILNSLCGGINKNMKKVVKFVT